MKTEWLARSGRPSLIVFCSGWAMDGMPFRYLASREYDVLSCCDYRTDAGREEIARVVGGYRRTLLIGWSMGVYYAQSYLADLAPHFYRCVAVNGTLAPVDDRFGIPVATFRATLNGLDEQTLLRFFRRMHKPDGDYRRFLASRPGRTLEEQREELRMMLDAATRIPEERSIYSGAVIARRDLIVPTKNQQSFWRNTPARMIEGCHFPFYRYRWWDELAAECLENIEKE